jgi:hypothetical protein
MGPHQEICAEAHAENAHDEKQIALGLFAVEIADDVFHEDVK